MEAEDRRTIVRIREMMNGPWSRIDEPTRQALTIIANEVDAMFEQLRELQHDLANMGDKVNRKLNVLNGLLITALASAIVSVLLRI